MAGSIESMARALVAIIAAIRATNWPKPMPGWGPGRTAAELEDMTLFFTGRTPKRRRARDAMAAI
jgi:hypothetical protein